MQLEPQWGSDRLERIWIGLAANPVDFIHIFTLL
jgi:hypothetical protein